MLILFSSLFFLLLPVFLSVVMTYSALSRAEALKLEESAPLSVPHRLDKKRSEDSVGVCQGTFVEKKNLILGKVETHFSAQQSQV